MLSVSVIMHFLLCIYVSVAVGIMSVHILMYLLDVFRRVFMYRCCGCRGVRHIFILLPPVSSRFELVIGWLLSIVSSSRVMTYT